MTLYSTDTVPSELNTIVADADYYDAKARHCFRMAEATQDARHAGTLRSLAFAFEQKARNLKE